MYARNTLVALSLCAILYAGGLVQAQQACDAAASEPRPATAPSETVENRPMEDSSPVRTIGEDRPETLGEYIALMAEKMDFYYTIEDQPSPVSGSLPWISGVKEFKADVELKSIDAFVEHANASLDGVRVVRSEKTPQVIHVIAEDLLHEQYIMDSVVTVEYSGSLIGLPIRIGELLGGGIESKLSGGIPAGISGDVITKVDVSAKDEKVRDVLTASVPLEGYRRLIWDAAKHDRSRDAMRYLGQEFSREDRIVLAEGLEGYLREMGDRLDCYFTFEDDRVADDDSNTWIIYSDEKIEYDFDVSNVDALAIKLERELNRSEASREGQDAERSESIAVLRSEFHPSVIHLVRTSLLHDGYLMNAQVDVEHRGNLGRILYRLASSLDDRLVPSYAPRLPMIGGELPGVNVKLDDVTLREALTRASPFDGKRRLIWQSARVRVDGSPKLLVGYFGERERAEKRSAAVEAGAESGSSSSSEKVAP